MYDISGETDRTVLLQSALLLGFYHSEKDLHTQPWYWSGIAISLCQIVGLHRTPVGSNLDLTTDDQTRRMQRRLWWCCFYRDRWLSLTLGRPLRINLNDCDVTLPDTTDWLDDLANVPTNELQDIWTPADRVCLAQDWVTLISLSKLLGEVLAFKYRHGFGESTFQRVKDLESTISKFTLDVTGHRDSQILTFSLLHLRLHFQ